MEKETIYLICYRSGYFRRGKIANVVGMKKITTYTNYSLSTIPNKSKICYHIMFEDGEQDYIDINDIQDNDWHFVTLAELLRVGMPK